ncbi:hypothetical protein XMIN_3389 [Xanthomonas citri pv. mangiferaeindicae LMG 941]|nr:hypothetical protein XMIN_3389 [Xanthomonas citri pv. mangiferaeindicae LMG 941]
MVAWAACCRQPRPTDSGGLMRSKPAGKSAAHKQTNKKRRSRAAQFQTSNRHSKRPQPRYAFPISDFRFPISDFRFPISDFRFPIPDSRFPIS